LHVEVEVDRPLPVFDTGIRPKRKCIVRNPGKCMLKLGSNTTQPRKKFQYVEIVLTNRGWQNKEIATWIGKANTVLLYRSMVTKREFSSTEKLSIFKSVFVRILTDGCET